MRLADSRNDNKPSLIFSCDVEDWGQAVLDRDLPISDYCADNVRRLLEILAADSSARGTFFVLGKFARRHPEVVREIFAGGHEIASHGYGHVEVFRQSPDVFREDLSAGIDAVCSVTGVAMHGYRAPVFSILRQNLWALDAMAETGFAYDSSIFPFAGRRYGIPDWPTDPCLVSLPNERSIVEYPLTVTPFIGKRWPVAGGGYARLLPGWLLCKLFAREASRRTWWPVFYCHPHEFDPLEFSRPVDQLPWGNQPLPMSLKLHQGIGRRPFTEKIRMLMNRFRFRSFADAMAEQMSPPTMESLVSDEHTTIETTLSPV